MKRFLTAILMILFVAGFSFEGLAANTFDASAVNAFAVSPILEDVSDSESGFVQDKGQSFSFSLFTSFLKEAVASSLANDLGIREIHGQPLPGVLITLLLGAAFGLARRKCALRHSAKDEQNAATAMLITARLFRMNILFLNPPESNHTISPGPDLFCLRE